MILSLLYLFLWPSMGHGNLFNIIPIFVQRFKAPTPLPVFYNAAKEDKVILTKKMSILDLYIKWIYDNPYQEMFALVILEEEIIDQQENIDLNQEIYFLTPSHEVYERYVINNLIITRKLGYFKNSEYVPKKEFHENAMKRRADFYGVELVALTGKFFHK